MTALVGLLAGVVMAQGLAATGPVTAPETSVHVVAGRLAILAGAGAVNRIAVTVAGQTYLVTDVVPVVAGSGCQPVTQTEVSCPVSSVASMLFELGDGDDTVWGSTADDTIYGGDGADKIHGGDGADTLYGGGGSDRLYGEDGDDYLDGGEWGDSMDGGPDDDTIVGSGQGMRDMVSYADRTSPVGVNMSGTDYDGESVDLPAGSGGELDDDGNLVEHDTITGVQDASTGSGNDILIGPDDFVPVQNSGTGTDLCDPNGDDGVKLADCVH
jgi:RTX calcium-binding nonapeptide repeat (4 copies)